jgi:hypothetical protein
MLLIYLFPAFTKDVVGQSTAKFAQKLGYGLLAIIATPIVIMILLFTLFASKVAIFLGLIFALALMLTGPIVALIIGALVVKFLSKEKELRFDWISVVVGVALVTLLKYVPVLGPILIAVVFLAVLGTLATMIYEKLKR